jgi:hypothetical protein
MSRALLAAFTAPGPLMAAVAATRDDGGAPLEAFTPYPVKGLSEALGHPATNIPWWMLAGGLTMAAIAYLTQWWSASFGYAFNQGGRPLNSWPAFVLAPVEIGVFLAAFTGFVAFLLKGGLPRLHHPLFDISSFERASQDQFILAVRLPEDSRSAGAARQRLFDQGAVWIEEVDL